MSVLRLTLAGLRSHGRRLFSTSLSVFIGVAFLAGTLVLGDTLRANFDDLFTEVNAGTDVEVRNATTIEADIARAPIDGSLVQRVASVDGVTRAEPVIDGIGQLLDAKGDVIGGNGPPQLAGTWIETPELNPYRLAEGRAPEATDEVVVNRGAAEDGDLTVGDRTTVLTPEPVEVTIVGLATFGDEDGLGGVTFTAFTLEGAKEHLTASPDAVSRIAVAGEEDLSQDELAGRVSEVLPDGVEAVTGTQVTDENNEDITNDFLGFFTTFLTVFAIVALVVAAFSIYNTFSIVGAQRTRDAALLRAVGASRRQILTSVMGETLLVGAVASVVGLAGGVGIAGLLKGLFDAAGFALPAGGTVFKSTTVVIALTTGIVVTLVAGLVPALRATRVPPLAAVREVAVDRTGSSRVRAVAGLALTAIGAAVVLVAAAGDGDSALSLTGLGALATLAGVVVLGPVVARPAAAFLAAPVARLRGLAGKLARENAMRNPRRAAGTASALMVGVAVVTLFTVVAASLKASLDETLTRSFGGDLVVVSGRFGSGGTSPRLAGEIDQLPEVDSAVGMGPGSVLIDDDSKQVTVVDAAALAGLLDVDMADGSLETLGGDEIAVTSETADSNDWTRGSNVAVTFADGATQELTIGAIYEPNQLLAGYIIPRSLWTPHGVQDTDSTVLIDVAQGTPLADARASIEAVAERFGGPKVLDRDDYLADVSASVDIFLTIVYALLALAILIALMGIANTLSLSIHERTRELGLLRAVGQTRAQVRSMVRWESVVLAVFGTVGGLGLGVFLGWALVGATASASGGPSAFTVPAGSLAIVLAVGAVAGLLASIRPARRAARLDMLRAIATE